MQSIDVNETYIITTDWWDGDQDPAEPTTITLTIISPSGVETVATKGDMTTPDIAPDVLDTWEYALLLDEAGVWRWSVTGEVDGATVTDLPGGMVLAGEGDVATGPCEPWTTWAEVTALCGTDVDLSTITPQQAEYLIDLATWVLWSLDGRRYSGICSTTRRICRTCITCGWGGICCCGVRDTIDLSGGRYPVWGVWDVTIDGEELAASAYSLRSHRWLDRIDGEFWPTWADITDPDSFRISWAYGRPPPIGLRMAAATFAAEMAKKCVGEECAIPERVTTIARDGVTYTILDPQRFIDDGRTGIYDVDLALNAAKTGRGNVAPGGYSPLHAGRG